MGPRSLPHLVRVWGERFYMPFAEHLVVFRYKDQPGMIGRVGHDLRRRTASTSAPPRSARRPRGDEAVLALTTDAPVPDELLEEILELEGFHAGRAVDF